MGVLGRVSWKGDLRCQKKGFCGFRRNMVDNAHLHASVRREERLKILVEESCALSKRWSLRCLFLELISSGHVRVYIKVQSNLYIHDYKPFFPSFLHFLLVSVTSNFGLVHSAVS